MGLVVFDRGKVDYFRRRCWLGIVIRVIVAWHNIDTALAAFGYAILLVKPVAVCVKRDYQLVAFPSLSLSRFNSITPQFTYIRPRDLYGSFAAAK